jgi:arylsulfatase A-like enzyme
MRAAWIVCCCLAFATPVFADQPNVVVILADDQGWGDLSTNGNETARTPHIDSIAREGAVLDRFFVCPVCAPTRSEFLTGRYHPRTGVRGVSTGQERLDLDETTLADCLRAAGYATGAFGKWHNGSQWPYHPLARGFEEYYGFTSGHWGEYFDPPLERNGLPVRGKGFIADEFTSHAIDFIEVNRARPFFCYLAFNTPHSPYIAPAQDWARFRDRPILQRGPQGDRESIDETRAVAAMNENLDSNVGRVLAKLDQCGLREKTIVVYFSDNGPNTSRWNGGMRGRKGSTDEGGVRSACFIRWPRRLSAGSTISHVTAAIDLMPTLLGLAGVPRMGGYPLDGRDLSPLLGATPAAWPDRMIFSHWAGKTSVRTDRFRLDAQGALFDMQADPGQTRDVASQNSEEARRLSQAVAEWRRDVLPRSADDRPFPAGYAQWARVVLPARDGLPHGGVRRSAAAPNCSYFVNWTSLDDRMTWDVEVAQQGVYEVEIHYTCREEDAGAAIELSFGDSRLAGRVQPAWDPPLIRDQDVIPRPQGESVMKDFHSLPLGMIRLEPARGLLTLRALEIPGKQVMDVRAVVLTLKPAD